MGFPNAWVNVSTQEGFNRYDMVLLVKGILALLNRVCAYSQTVPGARMLPSMHMGRQQIDRRLSLLSPSRLVPLTKMGRLMLPRKAKTVFLGFCLVYMGKDYIVYI
jgi:hypothetical protein